MGIGMDVIYDAIYLAGDGWYAVHYVEHFDGIKCQRADSQWILS